MDTVSEVIECYMDILGAHFIPDITNIVISYIYIVADTECEWCCDSNCETLSLYEDYWKPFKILCGEEYSHDGELTKDEFGERYNGDYHSESKFAEEMSYNYHPDEMESLPWFVKNGINWESVWDELSSYYVFYDGYVFSTEW